MLVRRDTRTRERHALSNPEGSSMSLSMYQASVPVLIRALGNLSNLLAKGQAHCTAKKIDETVMTGSRLYPDMFPLSRQIQIATIFGAGCPARLAGVDVPAFELAKTEVTRGQWRAAWRSGVSADSLDYCPYAHC